MGRRLRSWRRLFGLRSEKVAKAILRSGVKAITSLIAYGRYKHLYFFQRSFHTVF
jgi:hypothetical protein